jgi:excinuclease ABC subunit A
MTLRGVRVHNLKGVDLDLPLGRLIVFTGVSGSGKSSLAFDTLYAEGQRRYIETFSPYTRQFLEKLEKPDADQLEGIPPAIAVSQRVPRRSSRATVGSVTEVQEYLGLLYARVGRVVCRNCGLDVRPAHPDEVAKAINALADGTRFEIVYPLEIGPGSNRTELSKALREDGFVRVRSGDTLLSIEEADLPLPESGSVDVIVDRLRKGSDSLERRTDSIETAFDKGLGRCRILTDDQTLTFYRGWRCQRCGADYPAPEAHLFRPNSALGACPECEGFGRVIEMDLDRIVPDRSKSLRGGAVAPWTTPSYREWLADLLEAAPAAGLPTDVPFRNLSDEQAGLIVDGIPGSRFTGLRGFFRWLERKSYKMHVRIFLSRWRSYRPCPTCNGARLKPESLAVKLNGVDIATLLGMKISESRAFLRSLAVDLKSNPVARRVLEQVVNRLDYLDEIGLGYLTLDRQARTLSGGEAQRVGLTTALGSGLVNTLYVLDEPSIGLHPRDVGRLIGVIERLRDLGNTVVVVEHDERVVRAADVLVDIGPGAGVGGGQVLYMGKAEGLAHVEGSATADFLARRRRFLVPARRRARSAARLRLTEASGHNLKNVDVEFPLGLLCVVTGVSGAGKSTLVEETLYPALWRRLRKEHLPCEPFRELTGTSAIDSVELVDASPIGRSARSNPVTYLKAFDEIRKAFASTHEAKIRNYKPSQFSFNVEGGRCSACEGNGYLTIDMQFLADVMMRCPECRGTRYRPEVLEVTYRGKTIAEVLDLTAREAFSFFRHRPKVQARLRPLLDVGLDYLQLGQPATTLSGGEAQRLKLALFLAAGRASIARGGSRTKTLFILDEPTTGLHPADTLRLLEALNTLLDLGHSLIVVEHSPDVMAAADWIIDLGPEAGDAGGRIVAQGTPEDVGQTDTYTAQVLADVLGRR